jgi:hypothetical protein
MADNSSLPVASGNETFANDDIGGVKYPRPKVNWGPDGTANDVDVASGKPLPTQPRGSDGTDLSSSFRSYSASATFTPAAASHVGNDCNGAAAEIDFNAVSASRVMITSASLEIDGATAEATAWRLYLYSVTPPSATADDGAWDLPSGDRASYLGYVDLGTAVDLGSTQWVEVHGINKQIKLAGDSVFAYLVNLTTLTPANVSHIVTLHAVGM